MFNGYGYCQLEMVLFWKKTKQKKNKLLRYIYSDLVPNLWTP